MRTTPVSSVDPVEELRLRRWARENFVPPDNRDPSWHAVIQDEMRKRDEELDFYANLGETGRRVVPLAPATGNWMIDGPHRETAKAAVLASVPSLS